jgi:hypothetical protein
MSPATLSPFVVWHGGFQFPHDISGYRDLTESSWPKSTSCSRTQRAAGSVQRWSPVRIWSRAPVSQQPRQARSLTGLLRCWLSEAAREDECRIGVRLVCPHHALTHLRGKWDRPRSR